MDIFPLLASDSWMALLIPTSGHLPQILGGATQDIKATGVVN
jgi:hypothetical protein